MKVFLDRKNFNKNIKGKVKSNKEIFLHKKPIVTDELLPQVKEFIKDMEYISMCKIQEHFAIGFPRAYRIMKQLIALRFVEVEHKYKVNSSEFITYEF